MADPKRRILVTRKLPEAVEQRLSRDYDATFNPSDDLYDADVLVDAADGHDGLLVCSNDQVNRDLMDRLPSSVRIVATFSVGFEHVDVDAARERGLVCTNTPEVLTDATADVAMLLMLGAARRVSEGEAMLRAGQWTGWTPTQLMGTHITGKRLGIVGMGRIGQAVARRAMGFDMTVHYHNRSPLAPDIARGAIYHGDLDSLLAVSDVLSLHCPVTPETRGLLNAQRIARLPDGAIVVNTSRGAVVNDGDLIAALKSGKVAAAGLDVYEGEPQLHPDYPTLPNAMLAPHLGSATVETRNAMGFRALDNIDAFFAGREPGDRVA